MLISRIAAVILLGVSTTGCATVIRGTTTNFDISSVPPGAEVHTNSGFSCMATPCRLRMPRKDGFDVTASLAGYQSQTVHVRSKAAGAGVVAMTAGNFLLGGIVGSAVDVSDGATNDLAPNPLVITFVKVGADPTPPTAAADPAASPVPAPPAPPAPSDAPKS